MRILIITLLIFTGSCFVYSQNFDVDTIQFNGSSDTLINIVFLGDGYMQNELDKFVNDAKKASNTLFTCKPFSQYQNYFNIFIIKVPSNVSGAADNPENLIDNYFGSTYNAYYNIERLLVPMRFDNIMNVLANNFPSYDQVMMIVNDSKYGGSGGWVGTFSVNSSSSEIFLHELGHSFADLADEYWAGSQYAHEAINMTQEKNIEALKWKNWYGDFGIGLYPYSESPTWYRPHQSCKMRSLGSAFCSVCKEGIIEQIHDMVSPLVFYYPESSIIYPTVFPLLFKLELIKPDPNTLKIEWLLNNNQIELNRDSAMIDVADLVEGSNVLTAIIEDTTGLLRVDNHHSIHFSIVNWNIETSETGIKNIALSSKKTDISIFPNPFHDQLNIAFNEVLNKKLKVEIIDMKGSVIELYTLKPQKVYTINTANLDKGFYTVNLYTGNVFMASHKIIKN